MSDKSTEKLLKKGRRKIARIKLEFDKELEVLSGTILFPKKLDAAN
jgi:ribosome-interacting GTPase 1